MRNEFLNFEHKKISSSKSHDRKSWKLIRKYEPARLSTHQLPQLFNIFHFSPSMTLGILTKVQRVRRGLSSLLALREIAGKPHKFSLRALIKFIWKAFSPHYSRIHLIIYFRKLPQHWNALQAQIFFSIHIVGLWKKLKMKNRKNLFCSLITLNRMYSQTVVKDKKLVVGCDKRLMDMW